MSNQKKPVTVKDIIEVIQEPDFDDVEVQDVNDVLERLDFIVPQTDDPSTPTFTFRAVTIGVIWCLFLSFVNTLLSFRTNSFGVGANVALILSYPIGLAWHATFTQGGFLNPGPFNVKEHTLIYLLAACGTGTPYGLIPRYDE
ncbi:hypothetical protein HK100_008825 [Physocladia obscura]|uniref:Uncharacterized protein n=1 Tax=Physocladia obscura TaxID=109957 RepID=A0AAD5SQ26_9FUNG|nr:hypothetical protein HK100_008825 [Physocladia obscura]